MQSAQDAQRAREKAEGKSSGGRGAGAEDEEEKGGEEEDGGDGDDDDDEAGDPLRASTALLALGGASGDEEG